MQSFLARLLISALGLWLAATIVPGIAIQGVGTLILAALVMGVVNALVRPLAFILTLPITIVTLGIFLLVLNAAMFALVAWLLPGFSISGFWAALFGWLIVCIVSWFASAFVGRADQPFPR
jgi:putative membrane protein